MEKENNESTSRFSRETVYMNDVKKIVIIGPESTGKSSLCTQLAAHYQTIWCPEYAREFLLKNGTNYSFDDLLTIAKGQLDMEDSHHSIVSSQQSAVSNQQSAASSQQPVAVSSQQTTVRDEFTIDDSRLTKLLFIDTEMYVMKVWCEFVFGQCHQWILNKIVERKYDLYLLCKPDLPWVKDELREYPDMESREKLYHIYKDILINQPVPWVEINGGYEDRLPKAITAVDRITFID